MTTKPVTFTLYRLYAGDTLLYIGQTKNLRLRLWQHNHEKPWFSEVDRVTSEDYPTRREAYGAEMRAITAERPAHNVHYAKWKYKPNAQTVAA